MTSSRIEQNALFRSVAEKARTLVGGDVAVLCLEGSSATRRQFVATNSAATITIGAASTAGQGRLCRFVDLGELPLKPAACRDRCCPAISLPGPHQHVAAGVRTRQRVRGALCVAGPATPTIGSRGLIVLSELARLAGSSLATGTVGAQAESLGALDVRERFETNLHDGLAQTLAYVHLQVDRALDELPQGIDVRDRLAKARDTLEWITQGLRGGLDTCGEKTDGPRLLGQTLREVMAEVEGDTRVHLKIAADLLVAPRTASEVRLLVQEAIRNAQRHGRAQQVYVRLERERSAALVSVEDDGQGFDADHRVGDGRPHFGLSTMRLRAATIGGDLQVQSTPGHGTRVLLRWPCPEDHAGNLSA